MTRLTSLPTTTGRALLAGIAVLSALPSQAAELGAADETIQMAMLEWTGNNISTQIAGRILEKAGYKVEYVTAGNFPQFSGLSDGTLDASVEIWMMNVGDVYPKALESGLIENIGTLGLRSREGWIYTKATAEACPGLPDWHALMEPACVAALATPDTLPNGRFLDYPADWGARSANMLADNAMPYTAIPAGSEGAMVAELRAAAAGNTPLLMTFWEPHFVLADVEVGWVDMPPCDQANLERCIVPPPVDKVVWAGMKDKWPAAYGILTDFRMDTDQQQQMMLAVSEKGESLQAVADKWIAENEAVWRPWVDANVK
ncbi:ABC transporter substrate-binding protein [Tabrizicola oligotrophica]|uniref:ABC transporter substrate-binding protein n=1 Tax=Tabrizicola oligotrophica TaxID=2710650 RepID=A0A6M0QWI7_9RHOB|nr:ABC transporter substrate-binding protein [Tabrizicola oligotrophica]NEY91790.1 ABC transporter substrate-binding protein [Tabrizicola oligotrophica]